MRFAVLLRGVNAGPRNRIDMPVLRTALTEAGFVDVRTHVQSGNVVLTHPGAAGDVETGVRGILASHFGIGVDVIVRDEHALRAVVADNPLGAIATDARRHFVIFCSKPPDSARVPDSVAPEVLVARPMELHLRCPDGASASRLMPALGRRPPAPATTFRNWNTVATLAAMLDD